MEEKSYKCSGCGGMMVFDVASQSLKCPNCGQTVAIINDAGSVVEHDLRKASDRKIGAANKTSRTMECKSCGAIIEVEATSTAVTCPYCGTPYVLADKQMDVLIPDGVIPFRVDKNQVGDIFRNWMKKRWLAPKALRSLYQQDKLQGIYLPYWTFDAQVQCYYTAMGGRVRTETYRDRDGHEHTRTHTDWFPTSGHVSNFFDDVLVRASDKLNADLLARIEPYNTQKPNSYSPDYFAGYQSECGTRSLDTAHQEAVTKMERKLISMCESDVLRHYDSVRDVRIQPTYSGETYKHVMLPIYATAYTFKGKMYTVLINGQTGRIGGGYPKSAVKLILIAAAAAAAIGFIFFTLTRSEDDWDSAYAVESNMPESMQNKHQMALPVADAGEETETVVTADQYDWEMA